ncbi:hypothetical protein ACLKA6_018823 [Drosophila palustris]
MSGGSVRRYADALARISAANDHAWPRRTWRDSDSRCVILFAPPQPLGSDSGRKFSPSGGVRGYIQEEETGRPYLSFQGCPNVARIRTPGQIRGQRATWSPVKTPG